MNTPITLSQLQQNYPEYNFKSGVKFSFRPPRTILFVQNDPNFSSLILHELGHALLGHHNFTTDIKRLKMERAAWDKALELAQSLDVVIDENLIEAELETYRNWLHAKSKCQKCGLTRYQTHDGRYHCPHCNPN